MQDPLNAIRRLYGEPGAEDAADAPDARAEAEPFAALKAGLDALPPQRPDAATLDAVFAAAAAPVSEADVLAPLRAVYDDAPGAVDSPEAVAIAELKAGLDALPPQRPDAATLDAVFAAAAAPAGDAPPAVRPARAADRAPQRFITRRRTIVALGAAFALMLVLTSGLWLGTPSDSSLETVASAEEQAADLDTEVMPDVIEEDAAFEADTENLVAEAVPVSPPAADQTAASGAIAAGARRAEPEAEARVTARSSRSDDAPARAASPPAGGDVSAPADVAVARPEAAASFAAGNLEGQGVGDLALAADALPLADGNEAIQTLYLRMREMQAAQAGLGWDEPPVALGAAPDSVPVQSGWMQVRVER